MRRTFIRSLAPLAAIALIASGCSDDDDATDSSAADLTVAPEASGGADSVATGDTAATGAGTTPDTAQEVQTGESLLDTVKANGSLKCGVRDDLAGFSVVDEAGEFVGFDADFCRVIAAAVLGDATEVDVRRRSPPTPGSRPCSPARSTSSCATRRGRRAVTATRAPTSCTRRSTTASR